MQYVTPQYVTPLLGVIIGAALAFWAEKVRWRRSEDTRLGDIRRKAYADYSAAQKRDMYTCRQVAKGLGLYDGVGSKMTEDEYHAQFPKIRDDRNVSFEGLMIIGSEEVVGAAREWRDAVSSPLRSFVSEPNARAIPFDELWLRAIKARDRFYKAARADLGVSGDVSRESAYEVSTTEE